MPHVMFTLLNQIVKSSPFFLPFIIALVNAQREISICCHYGKLFMNRSNGMTQISTLPCVARDEHGDKKLITGKLGNWLFIFHRELLDLRRAPARGVVRATLISSVGSVH